MKIESLIAGILGFAAAAAQAQEVEVTRRGDGTVVIPAAEGDVTVTTRTEGRPSVAVDPRRGMRIEEKQLEQYLRERRKAREEWT